MSENEFLEQIRNGEAPDKEVLKKHMGSYRTKEVDQYIEKLTSRLYNMETVFQERYEEMRTNLLGVTRERDEQAQRTEDLEQKLKDMPKYCAAYLKEQGLVALPKEEYEKIQNIDLEEYESLKRTNFKQKSLEQNNLQLLNELEKADAFRIEAKEAAQKLEEIQIITQTQAEELEQLNLQLETEIKQAAQAKSELEKLETLHQGQTIELAQALSKYQMLELQYKLEMEKNQKLNREKESMEKEAVRAKELWDTERAFLIRRFQGVLQSQRQNMQHLQESVSAATQYMEKLGEDFLSKPAEISRDK